MRRRIPFFLFVLALVSSDSVFCQEFQKGTFRFGLEAGMNVAGDEFTHHLSDYEFHPSIGIAGEYMLTEDFGLEVTIRAAEFSKDLPKLFIERSETIIEYFRYNSRYITGLAGVYYPAGSYQGFTPIVGGRLGFMMYKSSSSSVLGTRVGEWEPAFVYGVIASLDYALTRSLSFRLDYCPLLTTSDNLDGLIQGDANDGLSIFSLGVYWNIRERARDSELLELADIPIPAGSADTPADRGTRQESASTSPGTAPSGSQRTAGDNAVESRPIPSTNSDGRNVTESDSPPPRATGDAGDTGAIQEPPAAESKGTADDAPTAPLRDEPAPSPVTSPPVPVSPATAPADCIATMLRISDFASLSDLRVNPQHLNLLVEQGKDAPRNFVASFELKSSGTVIASSTKRLTVPGRSKWFDANQFIDFNRLDTQLQLLDPLPMGEYSVTVSLTPERSVQPVHNEVRFHHIDIESIFGKEAASVRYLITTGKASSSMQNPQEIQLNVFGNQSNASDGPRISSCDTPEQLTAIRSAYERQLNTATLNRANERRKQGSPGERTPSTADASSRTKPSPDGREAESPSVPQDGTGSSSSTIPASVAGQPSPPVIIREPATAIPVSVPERERMSYLSNTVRSSVSKALSVASWMKSGTAVNEKVAIVLAEVYFAFDAAELTEESKQVLDYLARDLVKHPEFVLEIRGYADELGDASYNQILSQRRAERVVEYLGRRQVSETRIRARGLGSRSETQISNPNNQQLNRKAQIVLLTGK